MVHQLEAALFGLLVEVNAKAATSPSRESNAWNWMPLPLHIWQRRMSWAKFYLLPPRASLCVWLSGNNLRHQNT